MAEWSGWLTTEPLVLSYQSPWLSAQPVSWRDSVNQKAKEAIRKARPLWKETTKVNNKLGDELLQRLREEARRERKRYKRYLYPNPVAHCWSEPIHHKRKFCNVCRKRLEDSLSIHCEICEYFVHADCQDFAVADCKENATYLPGKDLATVHHQHHWREGNLPSNTKCAMCKKTCWSVECLSGMRCEWCGMTSHAICYRQVPGDCTFGNLEPIYLPPHAVSIPRTEVPMEAIIGVQVRRKETMSLTIKFNSYLVTVSYSHVRWTEKTIVEDSTTNGVERKAGLPGRKSTVALAVPALA
uniref:diacylglycerol kinase (ATP) n=1 Tax=Timema shepardi TaxID=629360 RepID=A0A7R9FZ08_TIMSH|nr:unnamed protein product [Timema shepardi]